MGQLKSIEASDDIESVFADELEPGHTLMQGQYTIEAFLNAGGFGITYRAKDSLDRPVVIKECFPGSFCRRTTTSVQARSRAHQRELSSIVRLFVEEARSLAKLDHPNIVGVHQVFEENNTAYMALDFVEGRDLLDMIEEPSDVLDQVVTILKKVLSAIGFIHKQGVLHRDISPDNILLTPEMEPILIDFGAAREEASKQSRVLSALRVVKDGYSPQEFYISGSEQGRFSDLYALGATFYHLITGELPANSQARLAAVASGEPDPYLPLVDRMPAYSESFLQGIDRSLEILPKDRIDSAEQWAGLLDGSVDLASLDKAQPGLTKTVAAAEPKKSSGRVLLLASVAVLVPIVGVLVMTQSETSNSDVQAAASSDDGSAIVTSPAIVAPSLVTSSDAVTAPTAATTADAPVTGDGATVAAADAGVEVVAPVTDLTSLILTPSSAASGQEAAAPADVTLPDGIVLPPALEAALPDSAAKIDAVSETPALASDTAEELAVDAKVVTEVVLPEALVKPVVNPTVEDAAAAVPDNVDLAMASTVAPVTLPATEAAVTEVAPVVPELAEVAAVPTPNPHPELFVQPALDDAASAASATSEVIDVAIAQPAVTEIQEVATPELASVDIAPTEAVTQEAVPSGPVLEEFDLPKVLSGWTVELPADVSTGANTVFAVNGLEVAGLQDIDAVLRQNFAAPEGAQSDVVVLTGESREVAASKIISAPVLQRTLFLNGLFFETRNVDGAWVTEVVSVPQSADMELREGDIIVGELATGARFDTRTSLPDLLTKAKAQNWNVVTLAVRRDGQLVTFDLSIPK
jgi:serine/threonine protein kinase